MSKSIKSQELNRRSFVKTLTGGVVATAVTPLVNNVQAREYPVSDIFHVSKIPDNPFFDKNNPNYHSGIEMLLPLMGEQG